MRRNRPGKRLLTEGEGALALAYGIVALFGAGLGLTTVTRLNEGAVFQRPYTNYESWIILSAAIGAAAALFLAGTRVGQPGVQGHLRGMMSTIWVSTVGAIVAGTLALPLYGTMFGPMLFFGTLAGQPLLAALWFANLFCAHLLIGKWRAERESLLHEPAAESQIRQGRGIGLAS